jgi:hypothetical protein
MVPTACPESRTENKLISTSIQHSTIPLLILIFLNASKGGAIFTVGFSMATSQHKKTHCLASAQQKNVISPLLDRKGFRKPISETATIKDY